jgi:hypothetical protein
MALSYGPSIVTDGLVLCLDAADTLSYPSPGTALWSDLSGQGNHGNLNTAGASFPSYNSDNGGSISFDGFSQNVIFTNNSFGALSNVTIEAWVKHTDPSQDVSYVGGVNGQPGGYTGFSIRKQSGNWRFYIGGGGKSQNDIVGDVYQANTIVHLVGTYDGTRMKFYTNGVLKTTNTNFSGNIAYYATLTTHIAGEDVYPPGTFVTSRNLTGSIYSYRLYNRVLTSSEVAQNFNALRGRFGV